jgi:hypothetical protein
MLLELVLMLILLELVLILLEDDCELVLMLLELALDKELLDEKLLDVELLDVLIDEKLDSSSHSPETKSTTTAVLMTGAGKSKIIYESFPPGS